MTAPLKISTKQIITASALLSICLVVFITVVANYYITRMSENNSQLYAAYRVSENIKSFRSNLVMLDNMQKRYMLTGDARFIEQHQQRETETKTLLKGMENFFAGGSLETTFEKLRDLTYKKLVEAKELKQGGNLAGLQGVTNSDEGSAKTLEEINVILDEMTSGLSLITEKLIYNSVTYLAASKKWTFVEIALGIIVAIVGIILLFRDINLRNQLELELRNAKKQAEENAVMKEQFMANVSHEIRTPMNSMLGFAELLKKTQLDATQHDYLNAIYNSGNNLLNIINDILDFSKIEAGKLRIEKIAFNLRVTLEVIKVMFAEKAAEKKIDFSIHTDGEVPHFLFGDPTRLNQVLINLVANAIKFTQSGSVKLNCGLKTLEHDVAQLVFRVTDTGIGIPADKLDGIFERFNQGNKETTRKYGGTGLGLAIVKSLVEIQNGTIYVKSREGAGSEFIVTISYPVAYEEKAPATAYKKLPPLSNSLASVLLVEDNTLNQRLASAFLQDFGLKVKVAGNGELALEELRQQHYELVLMDIQMPVLDGYNAARKIRNELHLDVPVIAMTAHVIEGEREKCLSFGMNDYISKPFKETELYAIVKKYLKGRETESSGFKSQTANRPVVHLKELQDLSRGNTTFIREMIDIFREQNPRDIAELQKAADNADYATIRLVTHRMKTSVGFMGLSYLVPQLTEAEKLAENQEQLPAIKQIIDAIHHDCEIAVTELQQYLTTL